MDDETKVFAWFVVGNIFNALDKVLTYIGLHMGAVEKNPFMLLLIDNFGIVAGLLLGMVLGIISMFFIFLRSDKNVMARRMLIIVAVCFVAVCVANLATIIVMVK